MTVDPISDTPLTLAFKLSMVLNLPAVFAGTLLAASFSFTSDFASLWASTLFVPILWFALGRWLDGVVGYRPRPAHKPGVWRGLWLLISTGLLLLAIASVTPLDHHWSADNLWVSFALILWSALALLISASGFIRRTPATGK